MAMSTSGVATELRAREPGDSIIDTPMTLGAKVITRRTQKYSWMNSKTAGDRAQDQGRPTRPFLWSDG